MNQNVRSAAVGAMAAIFVVAVAFGPKVIGQAGDGVAFRAASDSTPTSTPAAEETTTSTAAPTPTSSAPTTSTTTVDLAQRVTRVEERVTVVERIIEAPTTTTTVPVPPTAIFRGEEMTPQGWTIRFAAKIEAAWADRYPNPRILFNIVAADGSLQEVSVPIPPYEPGAYTSYPNYLVPGATGPVFGKLIAVDWDGGSLPGGLLGR